MFQYTTYFAILKSGWHKIKLILRHYCVSLSTNIAPSYTCLYLGDKYIIFSDLPTSIVHLCCKSSLQATRQLRHEISICDHQVTKYTNGMIFLYCLNMQFKNNRITLVASFHLFFHNIQGISEFLLFFILLLKKNYMLYRNTIFGGNFIGILTFDLVTYQIVKAEFTFQRQ